MKRKATMAEAKAAWDAHPCPSLRNVVKALEESGLTITIATLQRWKKVDFAPGEAWRRKATEIKATPNAAKKASAVVAKATQEIEGKGLTRLEVIEREEAEMAKEREKLLEETNLSKLAETAKRECLIASIVLARQITRRAPVLVEVMPDIAAKALNVLIEATRSTTIVLDDPNEAAAEGPANGDGAKVVEGRVIEESATAIAINAFKARRRTEAAA